MFALLSQVPYMIFLEWRGNVLFTLLLSLIILYLYDTRDQNIVFWAAFVVIIIVSASCDWGIIGPIVTLCYHALKGRYERFVIPAVLMIFVLGLPQLGPLVNGSSLDVLPNLLYALMAGIVATPLLMSYNGQRGCPLKYFFYLYYPLHILVLGLIRALLFGG